MLVSVDQLDTIGPARSSTRRVISVAQAPIDRCLVLGRLASKGARNRGSIVQIDGKTRLDGRGCVRRQAPSVRRARRRGL